MIQSSLERRPAPENLAGTRGRASESMLQSHASYSTLAALLNHGITVRGDAPGDYRAPCPHCSKRASDDALGVRIEPDGSAVWHCFRCDWRGCTQGPSRSSADIQESRRARERERIRRWADAAERARDLWAKSRAPNPQHRYLQSKQVFPHCARQLGDSLVLPVADLDGGLHTLQFIDPDGAKRLLSGGRKRGHSIPVQWAAEPGRVVIAEGFATAGTLAQWRPRLTVLAAIDADNLLPVAQKVRHRWPDAEIVIAGDDDRQTPGNPGAAAAERAATAVGGRMVLPNWPDDAPEDLTDFNDLERWQRAGREVR